MVDDATKGTFRKDPILGTSQQITGMVDLSEPIGRARTLASPEAQKITTLTSEAGNKINTYLSKLPEKLPFSEAHRVRSQLLKMKRMFSRANPADPAIGQISRAVKDIDTAMAEGAKKLKGKALSTWRTSNAFYKEGAEKHLNKNITEFLTKDPDQLAETLVSNSNLPLLKSLKAVFAKEAGAPGATKEWDSVIDLYFDKLVNKARIDEGEISVEKLINLFQREPKSVKDVLLGPTERKVFMQIMRDNPRTSRRLGDAILKQIDPSKLGRELVEKGDPLNLSFTKKLFKDSPENWKLIQKGFVENLVEKATKLDKAEATNFIDGDAFVKLLRDKSKTLDILFTSPKEKVILHRLKKIASTVQQVEKKDPASFGALMVVIKAAGAVGKVFKAGGRTLVGDPSAVPGAVAELGVFGGFPKIVGEIVTDPKATKWLISGLVAKPNSPAQRSAFINLENFIKSTIIGSGAPEDAQKEADFQRQIQEFQKTLSIRVGTTP